MKKLNMWLWLYTLLKNCDIKVSRFFDRHRPPPNIPVDKGTLFSLLKFSSEDMHIDLERGERREAQKEA